MWRLEYKKESWWFWLVTVIFLSLGVLSAPVFYKCAIFITIFQIVYFCSKLQVLTSFPIQVRVCYLCLLFIAQPEGLQWLYWIPTIGTWAQVLFGYCLMARIVSMLPWNREEKLSILHFKNTIFSRPVSGSIQQEKATQI